MKLHTISLRNFRLIESADIHLETGNRATLFVGPNNSGKTSVGEAIFAFLGSTTNLVFSDFSAHTHSTFHSFETAALATTAEGSEVALPALPSISMDLHLKYDDTAEDLSVAEDLLMDLDETSSEVVFRVVFAPILSNELAIAFAATRSKDTKVTLSEFLASQLQRYYEFQHYKVAADGTAVAIAADKVKKLVRRLIRIDFLPAQRHMDDQEATQQATKLSRLLNIHYERRYKVAQPESYEALEAAVRDQAEELTIKYKEAFAELKGALQAFGYPDTPDLNVRAELSAAGIFKNNTKIYYAAELDADGEAAAHQYELPERYNGLGFKNLIYMVLQLKAFRDEASNVEDGPRPRVHLVVVEEPEAHLHPQMQTVFLQKAQAFLQCGNADGAQLVITTHSSHIAATSGFTPVRYFRRKGARAVIKDLMAFERTQVGDARKAFEFVAQYLTVTRCDLFFCDKAILVEGAVERLVLPRMLELAAGQGNDLTQTYLSIVEVGGAYAHVFRNFIAFLEVPTLIITDIDSIDANRRKCRVADGQSTSNATLRQWLPGKDALQEIRESTAEQCTAGAIRVVFQIPETTGGSCGRTFEEAFCYANSEWLVANRQNLFATGDLFDHTTAADLVNDAFEIAFPKTDFAIDLILNSGWKTPRYIVDGLHWLSGQKP